MEVEGLMETVLSMFVALFSDTFPCGSRKEKWVILTVAIFFSISLPSSGNSNSFLLEFRRVTAHLTPHPSSHFPPTQLSCWREFGEIIAKVALISECRLFYFPQIFDFTRKHNLIAKIPCLMEWKTYQRNYWTNNLKNIFIYVFFLRSK